jgi:ABC-2 type transport system permease protein
MELRLALRKGETILLTLGIPVVFLTFFAEVHVVAVPTATPIAFLFPGIVALSIMSSSMVAPSIATGFERSYGVLLRLQATPLGTTRLLLAKIASTAIVEVLQVAVLSLVALACGFSLPAGTSAPAAWGQAVLLVVLATAAFGGIGLTMAGRLKGEVNLAAANGLYLVLLLVSGMVIPLGKLGGAAVVARLLPSGALADGLHALWSFGHPVSATTWIVLVVWSICAPAVAAATFRFAP